MLGSVSALSAVIIKDEKMGWGTKMLKWPLIIYSLGVVCAAALKNVSIDLWEYVRAMEESDASPDIAISLLNATNTKHLIDHQSGQYLCILTRITLPIYSYGVYSYFIQSVYAARHGYVMLPLLPDSRAADYAYHRKLQPIIEALETYSHLCAYVAWFDADLIPLDQEVNLLDKFSLHPNIDIVASRDVSTMINTGCLLVRNTAWALGFLQSWLACRKETGAHNEQLGFHCAYKTNSEDIMHAKVSVVAEHELNSIAPAMRTLLPSHSFLHLAAEDDAYRRHVFRAAAHSLLTSLQQGSRSIPVQLGITRQLLQEAAMSVYQDIYLHSHSVIQTHLQYPVQASVDLDVLERYRMSVSKYGFASEYSHAEQSELWDTAVQVLGLRSAAYEALLSVFCLYTSVVLAEEAHRHVLFGMATQKVVSMVMDALLSSKGGHDITASSTDEAMHPVAAELITASHQRDALSKDLFQSLPEIAKLTVELGYELLMGYVGTAASVRANAGSEDARELVLEIQSILLLLRHLVHSSQESMVTAMLHELNIFVQLSS